MLRNVTVTLPEEVAHWARRKAADENISLSKLIAKILSQQMRLSDEYWEAFEQWKRLEAIEGIDAAGRPSREELHARR